MDVDRVYLCKCNYYIFTSLKGGYMRDLFISVLGGALIGCLVGAIIGKVLSWM